VSARGLGVEWGVIVEISSLIARRGLLVRQLKSSRTGLAEELHTAEHMRGLDLRDHSALVAAHLWSHVQARHRAWHTLPCRRRMGHVVEGHVVQLVVLLLIIADIVAVFGELMLAHVCACSAHYESHSHSPPPAGASCKAEPTTTVEKWEHGLHWFSVSILALFALQQVLLIIAFGMHYFRKVRQSAHMRKGSVGAC